MTTKRKRGVEAEPEKDVQSASTPAKKRKGRMTIAEREKREFEMAKGMYVMSKIRKQKNSAGTDSVFESFLRLPSRRLEAEYYENAKDPIDITTMLHKLKTPDYSTYEQFKNDFLRFISNNLQYYKDDSDEHKDMVKIEELFNVAAEKVDSGEYLDDGEEDEEEEEVDEGSPADVDSAPSGAETGESSRESSPMELDDFMLCDLLGAVLEASDNTGRLLCPPFRVLQNKEDFPLYYQKIAQPIDLKTIAQKGKEKKYATMKDLKDDLFLLFKNAQEFSGKGSDIYKDAEVLKTVVREKIAKIEEKGVHPMRRAKAIRLVDALLTAVAVNDNFSEDSEEDEETEQNAEPMWKLYWTIRNATDEKNQDITLADNFLELPSKESYPDYYDEIKVPISIFMINKRLKSNQYDFKSLVSDLIQMYNNAFEYNLESSDVYIAADKLKALTLATCKQLVPDMDLSQYEQAQTTPVKPKATPHRARIKIEMPDTDSEDSRTPPPTHKRKSPKKPRAENGVTPKNRKSLTFDPNSGYTRHKGMMQSLWNCVHQYRAAGDPSYWPAGAFIDLPSVKQYPEYYQIIQTPIDMKIIRQRIDTQYYPHVEAMVADCRLMFANARDFNEPNSDIHKDAIQLEKILIRAYEAMRNQASGYASSMPSTPHSSGSNLMKMKTPKTDNRGRRKKVVESDDEETIARIQIQQQQRQMEDYIMQLPIEEQKMWRLFRAMKDLRDPEKDRPLAVNFLKLPSKEELPSYYEVIKKPMDMMRIKQKLEHRQYVTLLDVVSDFMLMLSNACKFNETNSEIYKEAVSLQKALLEMKRELDTGTDCPRVQVELRTIFTAIFASLFSKKDDDGNCYSDHLTEFNEVLKANGVPAEEWPYSLDQIKMNIDKCRYRRLDKLQKDFFDLFERARELSRAGTPMYEAACTLQKAFIVERDARCKDVIHSNAYSVIEKDIDEAIEKEKSQKAKDENDEEGGSKPAMVKRNESEVEMEEIEVDGEKYVAPCYAYVSRTDDKKTPLHIFRVERTFRNETGEKALQGYWVYRPEETLHLASRKFIKQEVFITPFRDTLLAERLRGKCVVVSLATFTTKVMSDFNEEDVYLCEFKYHGKPKYFSKLKTWPYSSEDEELECTKRAKPMTPKRVLKAADAEGKEDKEVVEEAEEEEDEDDRARCEVALDIDRYEYEASGANAEGDSGKTYFQQIRSTTGKFYWLGQFVLVFNARKPLCDVMRINKIWREEDGTEWFSGCWFARPVETIHDSGRLFYKNEVIGVYRNDEVRKLSEIERVCDVLPAKLYIKQRTTEVSECDVFVCETMINGSAGSPEDCSLIGYGTADDFADAQPMNLDYGKGMRKMKTYKLHQSIPNEELLFYKTAIKMDKELSPLLKSEGAMPLDHLDEMMEDDTDGSESVSSSINPGTKVKEEPTAAATVQSQTPSVSTPPQQQAPITGAGDMPIMTPKAVKSKSGYILFSAEVRKRIMHENPDAGFGEVSKIVGIEWKKLSEEQKKHYEMRAEVVAVEKAKQDAIKASQAMTLLPGQVRIYQCKWAACDSQYDSESGLLEHVIQHHTSQIIMDSDQQYVCMWMTCLRNRKDGKPFPSLPRLHRHIKEKHMPTAAKNVFMNQLGKNYFKVVPNQGDVPGSQVIAAPYGKVPATTNGVQQGHPNGINGVHPPHPQQVMNGQPMGQQMHPHPHMHQQQPQQHQPHGDHHPHQQQHFQQGPPHPQMQMSQVPNGMYQQGPSSSQQFHQGPPQMVQQQQAPPPQQQLQQVVVSDVGRTVVRAVVPAFVAPPNQIHSRRVLHSEAYLKYIESLAQNRQKSVSRWERSLGASHRNTQPNGQSRMPTHWIRRTENGRPVAREEDVTKALWKLRDELLQSTCSLVMDRPSQ